MTMPKETKKSDEKTYEVKYRLPGEEGRNPRKVKVDAKSQADAKKAAQASIPNAKIIGGPKEINEGLLDYASRVGKFMKRCVGRACLAYARTPVKAGGTIGTTRKLLTRELAASAGEKLVRSGGGEPGRVKITMGSSRKSKKRTRRRRK